MTTCSRQRKTLPPQFAWNCTEHLQDHYCDNKLKAEVVVTEQILIETTFTADFRLLWKF